MQEAELVGAASGSSVILSLAVVLIRDLIKNRNGSGLATKKDMESIEQELKEGREKLSIEIGKVYDEMRCMTKECTTRHLEIAGTMADHNARIEVIEKRR